MVEFLPELDPFFHEFSFRIGILLLSDIKIIVQCLLHLGHEHLVLGSVQIEHFFGHVVDQIKLGINHLPGLLQLSLSLLPRDITFELPRLLYLGLLLGQFVLEVFFGVLGLYAPFLSGEVGGAGGLNALGIRSIIQII